MKPMDKTVQFSKLPRAFKKNYSHFIEKEDKKYNINSFDQLGWVDPFPNEHYFDTKFEIPYNGEIIYDRSRYRDQFTPWVTFIPN